MVLERMRSANFSAFGLHVAMLRADNRERLMRMDPGEFARILCKWDSLPRDRFHVAYLTDEQVKSIEKRAIIYSGCNALHWPQKAEDLHKLLPNSGDVRMYLSTA